MKNCKKLSAMLLAASFLFISGCASTKNQEATGEYIDDTVITAKVKAAILHDPELHSAEINVETYKGDVQLSGFVSSEIIAHNAQKIAGSIKGVKSVYNDMRIK
jgi:hyperosmotically inducible protein